MEPTESVFVVAVLGEAMLGLSSWESSDTLWFRGEFRKTGVGSWTREPSNMDGTLLGRGGRWGGDLPRGGW